MKKTLFQFLLVFFLASCIGENVKICDQTWVTKNLNVTTYRNGDPIPEVSDKAAWKSLTTGAWCFPNNDPSNEAIYGKLYNWYAVNDPRGLAPAGYHVPSDVEVKTLITCLGGEAIGGGKMKVQGTAFWKAPNTGATNSSSFTALPAAYRFGTGQFAGDPSLGSGYPGIGFIGIWWTSSVGPWGPINYHLLNSGENVGLSYESKLFACSVRCIKD